MIKFETDYQEGCHPRILERLTATNLEQTSGYGVDPHCQRAKALVREAAGAPEAEVHFLVGGTQTNATVIKAFLAPSEGVICAESGHINVHESGAIESSGHKVLPLPDREGLLEAPVVRAYLEEFHADPTREHRVQPGMVYISHPSEDGTLYSREGLEALAAVCREFGLPLFLDGARLGYGLAVPGALTMPEIAALCDAFYIGGTKVGALFGEAVVFPRPGRVRHFRTLIKQGGGLLAKGRLLGIQFETLFEDGLYLQIAGHAIRQARRLREGLEAKGIPLLFNSPTNQQFPILTPEQRERLSRDFSFEIWQRMEDGRLAARFCTSWATRPEDLDALLAAIKEL